MYEDKSTNNYLDLKILLMIAVKCLCIRHIYCQMLTIVLLFGITVVNMRR